MTDVPLCVGESQTETLKDRITTYIHTADSVWGPLATVYTLTHKVIVTKMLINYKSCSFNAIIVALCQSHGRPKPINLNNWHVWLIKLTKCSYLSSTEVRNSFLFEIQFFQYFIAVPVGLFVWYLPITHIDLYKSGNLLFKNMSTLIYCIVS